MNRSHHNRQLQFEVNPSRRGQTPCPVAGCRRRHLPNFTWLLVLGVAVFWAQRQEVLRMVLQGEALGLAMEAPVPALCATVTRRHLVQLLMPVSNHPSSETKLRRGSGEVVYVQEWSRTPYLAAPGLQLVQAQSSARQCQGWMLLSRAELAAQNLHKYSWCRQAWLGFDRGFCLRAFARIFIIQCLWEMLPRVSILL